MKHLKVFKNTKDYQFYKSSNLYKTPNISSVIDSYEIFYNLFLFKSNNYLTISSLEDGLTVKLSNNPCQYSLDGKNWISLPTNTETPAINIGDKIYFKGNLIPTENHGIGGFTINKNFNLSGNVMSMLFGNDAEDNTDLTGYDHAFNGLFYNCTTLQSVSSEFLPATTLANYCYSGMFYGCTSLTQAPELPATTLANYCYGKMFAGCTSLVTAPELPATTLADSCYSFMFADCSSLVTASELPATTLAKGCYDGMFMYCSSLNYIKALFTTTPGSSYTNNWVNGVSPTGIFVKNDNATWNVIGDNGIPENWEIKNKSEELNILLKNVFTIEALENGLTVKLSNNPCQYSLDGKNWINLPTNTETPAINIGDKIYFKGNLIPTSSYGIGTFTISKKCNLSGSCITMLNNINLNTINDLTRYNYAFYRLFYNCDNIIDASQLKLPAATLSYSCYSGMFANCTSLTQAPELPATKLVSRCYQNMFQGCTSLTTAPELPATNLTDSCYEGMFARCTSLTTTPELPATTLADSCYAYMFQGCISLFKTMSELPATTLANSCYKYMFSECTSLTTAPVLPATILKYYCYDYMFSNCSKLNYIKAMFTTTPSQYYTTYWTYGVSSTGTFVKNDNASWNIIGVNGVPNGWVIVNETSEKFLNYCIIEALEDGLTVSFSQNSLLYSIDYGKNWNILSVGSTTPPINVGDMIIFKQTNLTPSATGIGTFSVNKKFNLKGSVMSLLFGDNTSVNSLKGYNYAFYSLFYNCTTLQSVSSEFIPATTLAYWCYAGMFAGCTSLTQAPELPATTLADYCYEGMFYGCTSLTTAPELPATTLAEWCYHSMFYNCTSLTTAPELPATTLADSCYGYMFKGCTSLVTTFILPATTLAKSCYTHMFSDCYSLKFVYNLPATTLANYCYSGMFYNCTSLVSAPELPATTLTTECYYEMFRYCTSLNYIKALFIETSDSYTTRWVYGVSSTGIFVKHPEARLVEGVNGIPYKWEVRENINNSYCIIEALEDGLTVSFSQNSLLYSIDYGKNWNILSVGESTQSINKGQMIYFKGNLTPSATGIGTFSVNKKFNLKGSVMSLLFGDNTSFNSLMGYDYAFYSLFYNCTTLQSVSSGFLPATTLANYCYYDMFKGCTSLVTAPELPAITLTSYCYRGMFNNCDSLTISPVLPATTLVNSCYAYMFQGCGNLYQITALFTTDPTFIPGPTPVYTTDWVSGVANTGIFYKNPTARWNTVGTYGVPLNWEVKTV